jgi:hypothetical protein
MADGDDLLKKAGGFFSKVGTTLRATTKQVTGLGRGTVRVELDRTRLAPGDVLHGRVALALTEAVDAKRLLVSLLAHQRTVEFQQRDGRRISASNRAEVYRFDHELGGAQTYDSRTIGFELGIPPDALDKQAPTGAHPFADAVRSMASALRPQAGPIEWSVAARLEIWWGRDLTHDVDISITR